MPWNAAGITAMRIIITAVDTDEEYCAWQGTRRL